MKVSVQKSGIRQSRWHEHLLRFGIGGAVTAATGLLAKAAGPRVAGLALALPAIFLAGLTLIAKHENEKVERGPVRGDRGRRAGTLDAAGAAMGSFGLAAFAAVAWLLLGRLPAMLALAAALVVWAVVAPGVWLACKRFNRGGKR
jgi:hypothetical protein